MSRYAALSPAPRLRAASRPRSVVLGAWAAAGVLLAVGCASAPHADPAPPSPADARAIAQLADIAPRTAELSGPSTGTDCWAPSESPLERAGDGSDTEFRVLCRVRFVEAGVDRYRDMICIGDLADDPVADHCYRWAYYTDMPGFEDRDAYAAPSA